MEEITEAKKSHHGANARRWREWRGINQDVLAEKIGVTQGTLSSYENSEILKPDVVEKLAKALDIPEQAITEMEDNLPINIFSGTWNDNSVAAPMMYYQSTFNPIDKIVELYEKKAELYERMIKAEQEKVELLQEVLKDKK